VGRISFQKRQKEMKRQEKQRMKAEKRAQRKVSKNAGSGSAEEPLGVVSENEVSQGSPTHPSFASNAVEIFPAETGPARDE
jgi:hypothetical protein